MRRLANDSFNYARRPYKLCFNGRMRCHLKVKVSYFVYIFCTPLIAKSTEREKLGAYSLLLLQPAGLYRALHTSDHAVTIEEDGIGHKISFYRVRLEIISAGLKNNNNDNWRYPLNECRTKEVSQKARRTTIEMTLTQESRADELLLDRIFPQESATRKNNMIPVAWLRSGKTASSCLKTSSTNNGCPVSASRWGPHYESVGALTIKTRRKHTHVGKRWTRWIYVMLGLPGTLDSTQRTIWLF